MKILKKTVLAALVAGFTLPVMAAQVNLNTASKDELLNGLQGLSEAQAEAIINYRENEGVFVKVPELLLIGIGPEIIEPNYNKLTVGEVNWGDKKQGRL